MVPSNFSACTSPPSLQQQEEDADGGELDSLSSDGEGQDVDGGELNSLGSDSEWEDSHGDRIGSRAAAARKRMQTSATKGRARPVADSAPGPVAARGRTRTTTAGAWCGATSGCG